VTISSLKVENFKAFEKFSVTFSQDAFLVGPNNAGKSTLISALKACAYMLRHASSKSPSVWERDKERQVLTYPMQQGAFGLITENLRHEFREMESRIELVFKNGARLTAVWPLLANGRGDDEEEEEVDEELWEEEQTGLEPEPEPESSGFFYLFLARGLQPRRPIDVRKGFPSLGVVPILTPIPLRETLKSRDHVRSNVDGRLASRHFRNQLYWYTSDPNADFEFDQYCDFVKTWLPDFAITELLVREENIDVFYEEKGSRVQKEISWAGDGVQVWLQLLLHVLRLAGSTTVVLDEPDVYLHPDLQRKLVHLLEEQPSQMIAATHSAEVLAESSPAKVVWVDKTRVRAVKAPREHLLAQLSRSLGSQFNLRLARALRTRVALFFEGNDMKLLRSMAETVGAHRVASETGVTCIPIEGYTNWSRVEAFAWLARDLLKSSVNMMLTLDRDYRGDAAVQAVIASLRAAGVEAHVWERHELESYLLVPSAISRVSRASEELVATMLDESVEELRADMFAGMHFEYIEARKRSGEHIIKITQAFSQDFDALWETKEWRLRAAPAKEVLSGLNAKLQASGHRSVSPRAISKALRRDELDDEIVYVLLEAEALAAEPEGVRG
jgi:energy-coupling factor transporter ATP-binding protein EcfA2